MELSDRTKETLKLLEDRRSQYSKCEVTFSIVKVNNVNRIHNGAIVFFNEKDSIPKKARLTYKNLILDQQIVSAEEGIKIVHRLINDNKITLPEFGEFELEANSISDVGGRDYEPAFQPYGFAYDRFGWPNRRIEYSIKTNSVPFDNLEVVSIQSPLYLSASYAIADFMNVSHPYNSVTSRIEIIIPDYRARIKKAYISNEKIKFEIEERETTENNLQFKYFLQSGSERKSGEVAIEKSNVITKYPNDTTLLEAVILDVSKNEAIDTKYVYPFRLEQWQETDPEAYEILIDRLIHDGENYRVEFKREMKDRPGEFLETVSSFSNSSGGVIILGVTNNGEKRGFRIDKDVITNIIASNCEPYPKFDIKEIKIDTISLTIVEIDEGENKPYSIKERGIFIRKNATDRQVSRSELDSIIKDKGSNVII